MMKEGKRCRKKDRVGYRAYKVTEMWHNSGLAFGGFKKQEICEPWLTVFRSLETPFQVYISYKVPYNSRKPVSSHRVPNSIP